MRLEAGTNRDRSIGRVAAGIAVGLGLALGGCTWVPLETAAEGVRVADASAVTHCERVGSARARTKVRVGIFARNEEKVREELETLARNDAPGLGGDTVVAEGPLGADGVQRFGVYDCSGR